MWVRWQTAAHKRVFLGSPAEGLVPQSPQSLTVRCKEGFLGNVKNYLQEATTPQLLCLSLR